MIGIYKIENLINGKIYIGQSTNISQRWKAHRNRPFNENSESYDCPLYRAIRKYGIENFSFVVLEETTKEELNEKERIWIASYNSNNPESGYNLTDGGDAITNSVLTLEQVHEIYSLLANTSLSQEEISKRFGVSQRTISGINTGQTWIETNRIYPIRNTETETKRCCDCGKKILSDSTRCSACEMKSRQKEPPISREELKKMIRNVPFLQIGRLFGVSDTAIRKWCKKMSLPSTKNEIKTYSEEEWEEI